MIWDYPCGKHGVLSKHPSGAVGGLNTDRSRETEVSVGHSQGMAGADFTEQEASPPPGGASRSQALPTYSVTTDGLTKQMSLC